MHEEKSILQIKDLLISKFYKKKILLVISR